MSDFIESAASASGSNWAPKIKYRVQVQDDTGLEAADYTTVYGDCPDQFDDIEEAKAWAEKLANSGNWPMGNPGYEVVEV